MNSPKDSNRFFLDNKGHGGN